MEEADSYTAVVKQCPHTPIAPPSHLCEEGRMHLFVDETTFLANTVASPNYGRRITVFQGQSIPRDEVTRLWSRCVRNYSENIQRAVDAGMCGARAMQQIVQALTSIIRQSSNYTDTPYVSERNFLGEAFGTADNTWKPSAMCGDSVELITAEGETLRFFVWSVQLYRPFKPNEQMESEYTIVNPM